MCDRLNEFERYLPKLKKVPLLVCPSSNPCLFWPFFLMLTTFFCFYRLPHFFPESIQGLSRKKREGGERGGTERGFVLAQWTSCFFQRKGQKKGRRRGVENTEVDTAFALIFLGDYDCSSSLVLFVVLYRPLFPFKNNIQDSSFWTPSWITIYFRTSGLDWFHWNRASMRP